MHLTALTTRHVRRTVLAPAATAGVLAASASSSDDDNDGNDTHNRVQRLR